MKKKNVNTGRVDYRNECRLEGSDYRLDITLPTHNERHAWRHRLYWSCSEWCRVWAQPRAGLTLSLPSPIPLLPYYYFGRARALFRVRTQVLTLIRLYVIIQQADAIYCTTSLGYCTLGPINKIGECPVVFRLDTMLFADGTIIQLVY